MSTKQSNNLSPDYVFKCAENILCNRLYQDNLNTTRRVNDKEQISLSSSYATQMK